MSKAISAVIATIMLLMITVSLVGVFYVFSSTLATTTTASGSEQASQLTSQLSMCMQIDNIIGNQITLRNCGKGVIENKSLVVMMGDVKLGASTATIQEGNSSVVNVSGLWQVPFGKHNLKISNGAAVALALVDVQPNGDGLVGSWGFDEGSGSSAYDASGNNNVGTLTNMNTTGNATSGWTAGKFGKGLQFDGADDYVNAGNGASLMSITNKATFEAWIKRPIFPVYNDPYKDYWVIMYLANNGNSLPDGFTNYFALTFYKNTLYGKYGASSGVDYGEVTTIPPTNEWIHIALVLDSPSSLKLYTNGVLSSQDTTIGGSLALGSTPVHIGNWKLTVDTSFNGTIDEVRIYNRSLSADETVTMKQII